MKRIVTIYSVLFAVLLLCSAEGAAMTKYFGRVADPVTGKAVKGAQVIVCLAGPMIKKMYSKETSRASA